MLDHALTTALSAVRPPVATSATLPPACYRDRGVLEAEYERIFSRCWVNVGRADRWQSPGDYAVVAVMDASVVVLRDGEGVLRAFANVCRHRGARLLDGAGRCRVIRCPFHRWTYGLDGRLLKAPRMEDAGAFDRESYGLLPVRLASSDGFVFVCLDAEAPPLATVLGDFSSVHAPWSLAELVTTRRRELEVACNWKAFLEVFNEYYHLPYVHPKSLASLYGEPDEPDRVSGEYATQFGTTEGTGALLQSEQAEALPTITGLAGRNREGVRYTWVYPNLTFAAGTDAVWVYEVTPLAPDRTRVAMSACFPAETVAQPGFDAQVEHYYKRLDDAIAEDIPALENQHAGLDSPLARQGRYCARLEPNVASFAFWYARKLG